jgi:hypothetical protein
MLYKVISWPTFCPNVENYPHMQRIIPGLLQPLFHGLVAILLLAFPGQAQTSQTVTTYGATELDARLALTQQIQGWGVLAGGIYCEPMYRLNNQNQRVI